MNERPTVLIIPDQEASFVSIRMVFKKNTAHSLRFKIHTALTQCLSKLWLKTESKFGPTAVTSSYSSGRNGDSSGGGAVALPRR